MTEKQSVPIQAERLIMQYVPYILLILPYILIILVFINLFWSVIIKKKKIHRSPVVCVCQVENLIGIILQRDLHRAERKFWKKVQGISPVEYHTNNNGRWMGEIISPSIKEVFVFDIYRQNEILEEILRRCYVQKAVFHVQKIHEPKDGEGKAALNHFFGEDTLCS